MSTQLSALILQSQMFLNLWASARSALGPNALCSPTGNIWEKIGLLKEGADQLKDHPRDQEPGGGGGDNLP
jgi:hypothetical protein